MMLRREQLKTFLYCTTCRQYCPTAHPRIQEWFDYHEKNCRPKTQGQRTSQSEPYAAWAQVHIQMSDAELDGYTCAVSPTELLAILCREPAPAQDQSRPPAYPPTRQGPY